ncbi:hypothetical protein J4216_00630 [Candidatus Woesearchaeota archaeon]|nr:hypothetical protein [Candidatus Woesearchaeota archaeon]
MDDKFNLLLKEANKAFNTADHLAYVSYPLLKDNKLLLAIANNLYLSGIKSIGVVLYYEKLNKRIDTLPLDYDNIIFVFENQVVNRMKLNKEIIRVIRELKIVLNQHSQSPLEFSRKNKFVICNNDYSKIKALDITMLKVYIGVIRSFIEFIGGLGQNNV